MTFKKREKTTVDRFIVEPLPNAHCRVGYIARDAISFFYCCNCALSLCPWGVLLDIGSLFEISPLITCIRRKKETKEPSSHMTAAANGANTCMKPWVFVLQRLNGGICFEPLIRERRALKHPWLDLTLYGSG